MATAGAQFGDVIKPGIYFNRETYSSRAIEPSKSAGLIIGV